MAVLRESEGGGGVKEGEREGGVGRVAGPGGGRERDRI
jgi:hypothetical protein